jgi:hypothetical protein
MEKGWTFNHVCEVFIQSSTGLTGYTMADLALLREIEERLPPEIQQMIWYWYYRKRQQERLTAFNRRLLQGEKKFIQWADYLYGCFTHPLSPYNAMSGKQFDDFMVKTSLVHANQLLLIFFSFKNRVRFSMKPFSTDFFVEKLYPEPSLERALKIHCITRSGNHLIVCLSLFNTDRTTEPLCTLLNKEKDVFYIHQYEKIIVLDRTDPTVFTLDFVQGYTLDEHHRPHFFAYQRRFDMLYDGKSVKIPMEHPPGCFIYKQKLESTYWVKQWSPVQLTDEEQRKLIFEQLTLSEGIKQDIVHSPYLHDPFMQDILSEATEFHFYSPWFRECLNDLKKHRDACPLCKFYTI